MNVIMNQTGVYLGHCFLQMGQEEFQFRNACDHIDHFL